MNYVLTGRLALMMFVQFFIWGSWATTLGNYMGTIGMSASIALAYSMGPIACIVAPFFVGMVADRFFHTEKVLGVLFLLSGVALAFMPAFAGSPLFLTLLGIHALAYFPSLSLTTSLSFHHMTNQEKEYPVVRVFGTIGWIVAGVIISKVFQADFEPTPLYIGAAASIFLGLYCFTLPATPPPAAGRKTSWREIAGIDALKQLRSRSLIVFLISAMLAYIAFGTYFPYAPVYLAGVGIDNPAFQMTFGQMSEIFFMLLIPFFFRRLGVKWMLMIGLTAWFVRFGLFSWAAIDATYWMIFLGIAIHGMCYDFFFVTGQIYIDKKTSPEIRGQVQGLLVLLSFGVGFLIGTQGSGMVFNSLVADGTLAPEQWRLFWGIFSAIALAFAIFFFAFFDDRVEDREDIDAIPVG
ncbi:MAG: MFS transporter [Rhodothermales bacterium]